MPLRNGTVPTFPEVTFQRKTGGGFHQPVLQFVSRTAAGSSSAVCSGSQPRDCQLLRFRAALQQAAFDALFSRCLGVGFGGAVCCFSSEFLSISRKFSVPAFRGLFDAFSGRFDGFQPVFDHCQRLLSGAAFAGNRRSDRQKVENFRQQFQVWFWLIGLFREFAAASPFGRVSCHRGFQRSRLSPAIMKLRNFFAIRRCGRWISATASRGCPAVAIAA